MNDTQNMTDIENAEVVEAKIREENSEDADRRIVGEAIIETNVTGSVILMWRAWLVNETDEGSHIHESTHYFAGLEAAHPFRVTGTVGEEWSTETTGDALIDELGDELTSDPYAAAEEVLKEADDEDKSHLGVGER